MFTYECQVCDECSDEYDTLEEADEAAAEHMALDHWPLVLEVME